MLNTPPAHSPADASDSAAAAARLYGEPTPTTQDSLTSEESAPSEAAKKRFKLTRGKKIILGVLGFLLVLVSIATLIGLFTYQRAMAFKSQAEKTETTARAMYAAFKAQNLPEAQTQLTQLEHDTADLRRTYESLGFYRFVPIANSYYTDGTHGLNAADAGLSAGKKSLEAIVPYADVLGFSGEGSFTGGTAEDRLKLVLQTLDKVSPTLDSITIDLQKVESELALIDPNRYPEEFRGRSIRPKIVQAQQLTHAATEAVTEFRPALEQLPNIAGGRGTRKKYLILFQNDNELRPTGGFLTAYSVINIENGKVDPEKSDDIYEMDKKFKKNIPIPESLGRYLTTEKRWNLRDMNISPDYEVSMKQFYEHYQEVPDEAQNIDGIIAVDTHMLTDLLRVLGPVEVPGYGTFSAENDPRCDCPQVVYALSEIITKPTPYLRADRKGILGPLMRSILTKAYAAPKQQWPQLVEIGLTSIEERHTQMYFFDEKDQAAAKAIGAAGIMEHKNQETDFLAIINANLGGAKSNLFVNYEVTQVVSAPENGMITKSVEITYRNDHKADNCNLEAGKLCLNSTLRDWTRLYLPKGSELVEAQGFTAEPKTYEEAGFSVIDGFFTLEPQSQAKLKLTYKVPYTDDSTYRLQIWKQGGLGTIPTVMEVNGGQEKIDVKSDTIYEAAF